MYQAALQHDATPFWESIEATDRGHLESAFSHSRADQKPITVSVRMVAGTRSVKWVSITTVPEKTSAPESLWYCYVADITEQINAERKLAEHQEMLELFVKHAPAAVAMFDRNMIYLAASQRWYDDYHLQKKNIIGMCHYDVFPEIPTRWRKDHQRVLNGEIFTADGDPFVRSDGTTQWLKYELHPWHTTEGTVGGLVMFTQDVTTQKTLELELANARNRAIEVSRLKTEFISNISHEIRTPINGIIGMAEVLWDSDLAPDDKEMVADVLRSSQHLMLIVEDMLDFSRIESGKLYIEHKPFNLADLINETVALFLGNENTHHNHITVQFLPHELPVYNGDERRIRQILNHLIGNAAKFTEQGRISIRTEISPFDLSRDCIRVEVIDSGIGIPVNQQSKLFEMFSQVDGSKTRKHGGTGLGLSFIKKLLELMGGTIGFVSSEETGSTFWFELQLERMKPHEKCFE